MKRSSASGFTLIEMGIVMVIIALIVTAVMAGQNLIQAATVKATISQIEEYQTTFNTFADRFQAWPGDFSRADEFLGADVSENGNGDTLIEWSTENPDGNFEGPLSWYQLQLAGLVNGQFGTGLGEDDAIPITVIPPSKIGGEGGGYAMDHDPAADGLGNHLVLGLYNPDEGGINSNPIITPRQAYDIDRKLDDNFPRSGLIRAEEETALACYTDDTVNEYQRASEDTACWIRYKLD